jgi:hypothetical protein
MGVPHSYHAEHQHAQAAQLLNVSEHKAKAYRYSGDFPCTDTVSRYGQYTRNGAPPCTVALVPRWGLFIDCPGRESDHSVMPYVYKITYPNGKIYIGQDRTDSANHFGSSSITQ